MGPNVTIGNMQIKFVSVKGSNHMEVIVIFPINMHPHAFLFCREAICRKNKSNCFAY